MAEWIIIFQGGGDDRFGIYCMTKEIPRQSQKLPCHSNTTVCFYIYVTLTIRAYRPEDRALFFDTILQLQQHIVESDPQKRQRLPSGHATQLAMNALAAVHDTTGAIYIAWDDDTFAGVIVGHTEPRQTVEQDQIVSCLGGVISDIFVIESARRRGVGKKLVAALQEHFLRKGCIVFGVSTNAFNQAALRFWAELGYHQHVIHLMKHPE